MNLTTEPTAPPIEDLQDRREEKIDEQGFQCDVIDYNSDDSQPPPPYSYLPPEPRDFDTSSVWAELSGGLCSTESSNPKVRLGYVDFVPRLIRRRLFRNSLYETFDALISHANNWLDDHQALTVVACESLAWPGLKTKHIYSDSTSFLTSMNARKPTKYLRGLRLWYFIEVFPSTSARSTCIPHLNCRSFIPSRKETYQQLISRVNKNLAEKPIGHILNIETFKVKLPSSSHARARPVYQTQRNHWKEHPGITKRYMLCIRIFAFDQTQTVGQVAVDYHDFVTENYRTHHLTSGYALFGDVMQQVGRWVALKHGVRFTNVQTLRLKMKRKKKISSRCIYTEHLTASNRVNLFRGFNRKTRYLSIIRVYYVTSSDVSNLESQPPISMTYRTFNPNHIQVTSTRDFVGNLLQESAYMPCTDRMSQMLSKINEWLQITGAKVFGIETVIAPYLLGNSPSFGSEITYYRHSARGQRSNKWIMYIRLYLDGEYEETPEALRLTEKGAQHTSGR